MEDAPFRRVGGTPMTTRLTSFSVVAGRDFGQIWVSRRNFVQDLRHRYLVYIDGNVVGELPPYRTGRYQVPAGFHRVWARRTHMPDAILGDVVINVLPGEIRRVRTTSRLKRLPFGRLIVVLVTSALDRSGQGLSMKSVRPSCSELGPAQNRTRIHHRTFGELTQPRTPMGELRSIAQGAPERREGARVAGMIMAVADTTPVGDPEPPSFEAEGRPSHDWFSDGQPIVLRLFPEWVVGLVPVFPQSDDTDALIPQGLSKRLIAWNHFNANCHWERGWQSEDSKSKWAEEAAPLIAELRDALKGKAELVVDLWPLEPFDH